MGRPKERETKTACILLGVDTYNKLDTYAKESMIPKSKVVEKALVSYLSTCMKED